MAEEKKRADTITKAIHRKADARLKDDVADLYKKICEFIIERGGGAKMAGFDKAPREVEHTPSLIMISMKVGEVISAYEVIPENFLRAIPQALESVCLEGFRNKQVGEFIESVEKVNGLEEWVEDISSHINQR